MSTDPDELRAILQTATEMVARTSEVVRERLRGEVAFRRKADRTLVSAIDLEVESLLRADIGRLFPADGVLGEEEGETAAGAPRRWVLDPIDGTRSLRHRIPLFGTLVALQQRGAADGAWETLVGVVTLPAIDRLYGAARGLGAFRDGERLVQLPAVEEGIAEEVISLGERRQFVGAGCPEVFDHLVAVHPGARVYPDCFAHALAAEGSLGAMVDFDLRPWDLAATQILVEEAGGRCAVLAERDDGTVVRRDVVLGKPAVVEWVVAEIARLRAGRLTAGGAATGSSLSS